MIWFSPVEKLGISVENWVNLVENIDKLVKKVWEIENENFV